MYFTFLFEIDETSTNLGEIEARETGLELDFQYHDHDQLTRYLRAVSAKYPALTALYSIGKSVQGENIYKYNSTVKLFQ